MRHEHAPERQQPDVAIARRMLDYPKTLDNQWLLEFTLERLAGDK